MLIISIEQDGDHETHRHADGPLLIGRECAGPEPFIEVRDDYVSRRQLVIEQCAEYRLRFQNLGRNEVRLPDGRRFGKGESGESELPTRLQLTRTVIVVDVERPSGVGGPIDDGNVVDTLTPTETSVETPTGTLTGTTPAALADTTLAMLGDAPSAETITRWLETLLSVQRSVVGSQAFFQETSRALVELIGLDRGLVLLREGSGWKRVASYSRHAEAEPECSQSILSRVVEDGGTCISHPRGRNAHDSLRKLEAAVGSPIFDEDGAIVGILYGSRDYSMHRGSTAIRALEAQLVQLLAHSVTMGLHRMAMLKRLQQAEQLAAVGQALGYIVHDLRGPLGNAQRLTEMMRQPAPTDMPHDQQLDFLDESLAVSLDLLHDTLDFCRGSVQLQVTRGNCRELLGKHLRGLAMTLESLGVKLVVEIPESLSVAFDAAKIARVLHNLAKNAGEALNGATEGKVVVAVSAVADGTRFSVSDNGSGLPPEVQEKLFQPFATHGKEGGTGFGLAIAKQLVDAHDGTIEVDSGPGGTTFTIIVPHREAEAAPSGDKNVVSRAEVSDADLRKRELRVLAAEDGRINQAMIRGMLKELGCQSRIVGDGKMAVSEFETKSYDVILMDVEMPELNGLEATRLIRQQEPLGERQIPIVGLTAHEDEAIRRECLCAGMNDVLVKPLHPDSLARVIRDATVPDTALFERLDDSDDSEDSSW